VGCLRVADRTWLLRPCDFGKLLILPAGDGEDLGGGLNKISNTATLRLQRSRLFGVQSRIRELRWTFRLRVGDGPLGKHGL
jgi:hypothetical protein